MWPSISHCATAFIIIVSHTPLGWFYCRISIFCVYKCLSKFHFTRRRSLEAAFTVEDIRPTHLKCMKSFKALREWQRAWHVLYCEQLLVKRLRHMFLPAYFLSFCVKQGARNWGPSGWFSLSVYKQNKWYRQIELK